MSRSSQIQPGCPPQSPRRSLSRSTILLALVALLIPAQAGQSAPAARPTPQAAEAAPQFLRDLTGLGGQLDGATSWISGGDFLYWARCNRSNPGDGYLRRWPLAGGRAVTLHSGSFCGAHWDADATGLYYWDDGNIMVRRTGDPFRALVVAASPLPQDQIVLTDDAFWSGYVFWLANDTIYTADKNFLGSVANPEPAGAGARSLMFAGDSVYWFGDGVLYSANKLCLAFGGGSCIKTPIAGETGDSLIDARLSRPSRSMSIFPLWLSGPDIRGVRCVGFPGSCAPAAAYTAPNINGDQYRPGSLATDGRFLFWVENVLSCVIRCRWIENGRLMKWSLDESILGSDPFSSPQPIAFANSGGAMYTISTPEIGIADGWVYFNTSNGVSRIRADAPPIAWDLAVAGLEVTQGVQGLNNDVPLIADKPTYVRLFGDKLSGPNVSGVDARLYGSTAAGAPLPGSPLGPVNGTQSFAANNAGVRRADPNGGWIFQLPDAWTSAGSIRLSALIDPRQVWNDPNRANNALAATPFSFVRKAPICIVFVPVRTVPPVQLFTPSHWFAVDMVRRLMPTPDVWVHHQAGNDLAEVEIKWGGPFNAIPYPDYGPYEMEDDSWKVMLSLWTRDQLSDDPDRCDDARARTHYVGVVSAGAGGINGSGRLGGDQLWFRLPPDDLSRDWMTDRAATLAHELGHNYGRRHVDCGGPDSSSFYPYPPCQLDHDDGASRHYGFTYNPTRGRFETIAPSTTGDLMSYAAQRWTSDFSWNGIRNEIPNGALPRAALAGVAEGQRSDLADASSVVMVGGAVDTADPAGAALEHALVLPADAVSPQVLAKWRRTAAPAADPALAGAPAAGAYHLRLVGPDGSVLDDRAITLEDNADDGGTVATFLLTFPAPAAPVASVELADGGTVLARLAPGASPPTVSVISPAGGEIFDSQMSISWRASDSDSGDLLLYTVQYSPDDGATWRTLLTGFPNLSGTDTATVDLKSLGGLPASTSGGRIRVIASDGYNTALASSNPFSVPDRGPQPTIISPWPGQSIPAGQTVTLQGAASDAEEGSLSGEALRWSLDGEEIGSGPQQTIAGLAPGSYSVTLTARDAAGHEQAASTTLTVEALRVPLGGAPTLDGACSDDAYAGAAQVQIAPYGDGAQATVQLLRTQGHLWACFSNMARAGGSSPGSLAVLRVDTNHSRESALQPGDYVLVLGEDGILTTYDGPVTPGPGGIATQVSANETTWQAELAIEAGVLGGWGRVVGLDVEHAWVNAVADDYYWPHRALWSDPSSWATAVLGEAPRIDSLAPASAAAGGGDFTLTVSGENFAEGAIVRWSGEARPTTVISSGQVQASISAGDIAAAGTAAVTVANPAMGAAASNARPFFIGGSPGQAEGPHRLFLPLALR